MGRRRANIGIVKGIVTLVKTARAIKIRCGEFMVRV